MKKVISFSLWGNNPEYLIGAIKNMELQPQIYPDWICRFYCGRSVPQTVIDALKTKSEIIYMDEQGDWTGMFWRFYPCSDPDVDVMLSRDCDSRLNVREKAMVDEFLESDKSFHTIKDHYFHTYPIMGGMWGCKYPKLNFMKSAIIAYPKENRLNTDQEFLERVIWPVVKDDCIEHTSDYPVKLPDGQFVGQQWMSSDKPYEKPR